MLIMFLLIIIIMKGIKWHVALHMPPMIDLFGLPKLFDMIHFEHGHKKLVKDPFKRTSGRFGDIDNEILRRLETKTIIKDVRDIYRRDFQQKESFALTSRQNNSMLSYRTNEGKSICIIGGSICIINEVTCI